MDTYACHCRTYLFWKPLAKFEYFLVIYFRRKFLVQEWVTWHSTIEEVFIESTECGYLSKFESEP